MEIKKILIIGGGFGGVRTALDLDKRKIPNASIALVSDRPHFEYHPALYRVVTGRSPLEVCIPLRDVFEGKEVAVAQDRIVGIDLAGKTVEGFSGTYYKYDFLVLALGSETEYFDIPGLPELSFGFKSINEALRLKRHLQELFEGMAKEDHGDKVKSASFIVIGGGASGVELAGDLAVYAAKLAENHKIDPSLVTIDLVERAPRLLPSMPKELSATVTLKLRSLGVNIFVNRAVVKEEVEAVHLKDMEMKTKTVIWTAGVKPHHLYSKNNGMPLDENGGGAVDDHLQIKGHPGVFVIGDAAATKYSGMAQTAIRDGGYVAEFIASKILKKNIAPYKPVKPLYAFPVGPGWAAILIRKIKIYGRLGWWMRRFVDLNFFSTILPFRKALLAFQNRKTLCESCMICSLEGGENRNV